ncbi:MAG: metal-dependent transcriptional regulator [Candidatus Tectomicrobia bacterium]|uniref:Metal-dependent transcriptional regulator n=1 Tax=Tectimicrobiota bacterium TaxID=2528274 RepID=A0A932CLC4_UNCTE|nr:metal-dependent transcriptional regulator [Candidatus Tectomicrobia bacterium]
MGYQEVDELLEQIWTAREEGRVLLRELLGPGEEEAALAEGIQQGLLLLRQREPAAPQATAPVSERSSGSPSRERLEVALSPEGEKRARDIIRRHRLAELLFSEIFELEDAPMESGACNFEHLLAPKIIESVCTFLGHPRRCPHGKPIPPDECCNRFQVDIQPLVIRLSDLPLGEEGRIVFITPKQRTRLDRLSALGLIPGSMVRLHQRQPSYVISIGETEMALDREIACEIYVRKA